MGTEKEVPSPEAESARDAKMAEILDKMRVLLTGEQPRTAPQAAEPPEPVFLTPAPPKAEVQHPSIPQSQGAQELFPHVVVDRLMAGQSPVQIYREYRGMTREALAQKAGVSIETLASLEAGIDTIVLRKIADALEIDVRKLM